MTRNWYTFNYTEADGYADVAKPSTYQLSVGLILSYATSTNATNKGYYTKYTTNLEKLTAEHQKALFDVLKTTYDSKTFTVDTTDWTDDEKAALTAITEVIGKVYSNSPPFFYVTHRLVDGELVEVPDSTIGSGNNPAAGTKHQYAYFMPVIYEKDGQRYIVDGIDRAKCAVIITERPKEICQKLTSVFGSGVTYLDARGGYSDKEKTMIYFIVNRYQVVRMKEIVHEIDHHAYITISEVADVYSNNNR
jgi:hypothetical protein